MIELLGKADVNELMKQDQTNNINQLLRKDQLLKERKEGHCFVGFLEPPIRFLPTYRYNRGDRTFSEEVRRGCGFGFDCAIIFTTLFVCFPFLQKNRTPSYCDRILYRHVPGVEVDCKEYKSVTTILTRYKHLLSNQNRLNISSSSDHSPVLGKYDVTTQLPKNFLGMDEAETIIVLQKLQLTCIGAARTVNNPTLEFRAPFLVENVSSDIASHVSFAHN